jgi:hypothetical protein
LTFELVVTDNKVYQAPPLPWTLLLKWFKVVIMTITSGLD